MSKGVIDLSYLDSMVMGDADMKREMIVIMVEEIPQELGEMNKMLSTRDWNALGAKAHKLKSTANLFGNSNLAEMLKVLELDARNGNRLDGIGGQLEKVEEIANEAVAELKLLL